MIKEIVVCNMTLAEFIMIFFIITNMIDAFSAVSCPNGDTAGIIKDSLTCSELIADDNSECYDTNIVTSCCASCNTVARNNQNCLYGDKAVCFSFLCPSYTDINTCCETCASSITTQSKTPSTASSTSRSTSTKSSTLATSTKIDFTQENTDGLSNTNGNSKNDAVIAGAVVGGVVGMTFLLLGAIVAVKMLKKKENRVADGESSGIPEKLDRNSGFITEKVDICTVLQEKLDTNSEFTGNHSDVKKGHQEAQSISHIYTNNEKNDKNNKSNEMFSNDLDQ